MQLRNKILPALFTILALAFAVLAPPRAVADDTLKNEQTVLLQNYVTPASATTLIATNIAPGANNIAKASWQPGRAGLETLTLTIVATNASTADVNIIVGPSTDGSNVDHTVNFFKFKGTLAGTTPVVVTTNIPSALLGGAKFFLVYSEQNAHTATIRTTLVRSGWNK